jgi:CDP-glucose 4,6-dehydratase
LIFRPLDLSTLQPFNPSTSAVFGGAYRGKRVLVTGHTGFKGAWLAEWLLALGADVAGLALPPPTSPALFDQLVLAGRLRHEVGDIRDLATVRRVVEDFRPEFIFHLAAQSLVRLSYDQPVETYATNVLGTVHVLEAVRLAGRPCVVVAITTDKCYDNKEWVHGYREEDPLGGHDPYSSSKGAAEIAIAAYRRSYFSGPDRPVRLASARAGNVVGGGDWAPARLVPDCIRALQRGETISVRNQTATRPWQHVLEPLSGYLWLGARLNGAPLSRGKVESLQGAAPPTPQPLNPSTSRFLNPPTFEPALCSAFNFGPALTSNRTVAGLVQEILRHWPGRWEDRSDPRAVHEARLLNLATDKAFHLLQWQPVWSFEPTIARTVAWYRQVVADPGAAPALTTAQIADYTAAAQADGVPWAT